MPKNFSKHFFNGTTKESTNSNNFTSGVNLYKNDTNKKNSKEENKDRNAFINVFRKYEYKNIILNKSLFFDKIKIKSKVKEVNKNIKNNNNNYLNQSSIYS